MCAGNRVAHNCVSFGKQHSYPLVKYFGNKITYLIIDAQKISRHHSLFLYSSSLLALGVLYIQNYVQRWQEREYNLFERMLKKGITNNKIVKFFKDIFESDLKRCNRMP